MICLAVKKHRSQANIDCIVSFHTTFEGSGVKKDFIMQIFPLWLDKGEMLHLFIMLSSSDLLILVAYL